MKLFEQARLAYENSSYDKSLNLLDEILALDSNYMKAYLLKSDIYQESDSLNPLIKTVESALRIDPEKFPKLYFILGNAYFKNGTYQKANESYQNYQKRTDEKSPLTARTLEYMKKCAVAIRLINNPVPFQATNLGENINSEANEYWPSLTVDGKTLIYTRLVGSNAVTGWTPGKPLSAINTADNEGAQSISADGKLLFFTSCGRKDSRGSCDIYFSRNYGGSWSTPQNVGEPVNSSAWESQPSISANGETLYFVSNRKGGKGGMDIWKCKLKGFSEWGSPIWSNPVNLGDSINTSGNEMSPFIHADGKTLYFASDSWPGLGGTDLFYSRQKNDSTWSMPKNMGYPINSNKDEQGLIVDATGQNAYYSTNRSGSKGLDIYSFKLYPEAQPKPVSYIKGRVTDKDSLTPIAANIELIDLEHPGSAIKTESSNHQGEFLMCLPLDKEYAFNISKDGYLFYSENFKLKDITDIVSPHIVEIKLTRIQLGGSVILRNIFFNTASAELLPESKVELQQLIDFMRQNRTLEIEIGGHTDTVGTAEFNQNLSEQRAKEVYNYLIENGIEKSRMTYKGYGYTKPISSNNTEEGRTQNRRTEFRITKK